MQKLLKDRKITLDLTDAAKRWLGRVGYDPVYGARPLKRAVQRYLQDPLAEKLLGGEIPDGARSRSTRATGRWRSRSAERGSLTADKKRGGPRAALFVSRPGRS